MGRLDDEHIGGKFLLLLGDVLTTLLLTLGTALAWLSVYILPGDPLMDLGAVIACCAAASVASAALLTWRHGLWAALALLAAGGLTCWRLWEKLAEGWLPGRSPSLLDLLDKYPAALYLLCALLALVMGLAAVKARAWYLAALLSIAPVLPAIIGGTLPMWGAMLASFSAWGAMLLTSRFSRRNPVGLGRAKMVSLAGMWGMILLLVMALPMEGYLRPQWATDARNDLIRSVTTRMERYFDMDSLPLLADLGLDLSLPDETPVGSGGSTGIAGSGDAGISGAFGGGSSWRKENLRTLGPRRYQNRQVMTVETDDPDAPGQTLYLLGGTLNTYTGESWEQSSRLPPWQPVASFPASTAPEGPEYTMSVHYSNLFGAWYYPYRFLDGGNPDESGRLSDVPWINLTETAEEDTMGLPDRGRMYEITYRPGGPEDGYEGIPVGWVETERDYRGDSPDFEADYLAVPDGLRATLEPLVEELEQTTPASADEALPEQFRTSVAAAARTAALLETLAVYDLDTPAAGPGADFIEHFLAEGRGYCVHFATAGVLLLRMQGIPARYAAGYVAQLNRQGQARVLDSDAHAWAEIYLDGYGWYPVEMTPGYAGGESGVELTGNPEEESSEEPDAPDEEPEDETPDAPEDPGDGEGPSDETPGETEEGVAIPWRALGVSALVLAALGGLYGLLLLLRRRARGDADTNRSVLAAYRRYSLVLGLGGAEDDAMEALGRKAKFSQHTLTEEERSAAWQRLEEAAEMARKRQKPLKRWILKLLHPIL